MIDIGRLVPDFTAAWHRRRTESDWAGQATLRFRDLVLYRNGPLITVLACDSNAGIGDQPADIIRQSSRLTGYAAAKVPLMEVLASGATPLIVINNLGTSLAGPGREVLEGIRDCLRHSGTAAVLTGSDETNVATTQSGVGVTVIGIAEPEELLLGGSRPGDVIVVIGTPKDGITVPYGERDADIVTAQDVGTLARHGAVHELLPVGSKGVGYEMAQLAAGAGLSLAPCASSINLSLSAGASTCVLASCAPSDVDLLTLIAGKPATVIGFLIP